MQQEADMLHNMFLVNQYVQQESSKLKLKQTDTNSLAFKAIMNSTENEFGHYSNAQTTLAKQTLNNAKHETRNRTFPQNEFN